MTNYRNLGRHLNEEEKEQLYSDWADYSDNVTADTQDHDRLMDIAKRFELVLMEDFARWENNT